MTKVKKNLELLYKRIRETESETRRKSLKHQEAIEATLILLSDLTTIVYEMLGEIKEVSLPLNSKVEKQLTAKEQFIKEIWEKEQELKRCRPQDKQLIEEELAEMKQEFQDYLEFQKEAEGGSR